MDIYRKQAPREKRPPGRLPTFTSEYMFMVAEKVVEDGMKYREAAKTFGISQGAVARWVKKYRKGSLGAVDKKMDCSPEVKIYRMEEQMKDLKSEIGSLYLENQLLKKALLLSQQKKKDTSSVITSENLAQYRKGAK